MIGCGAINYAGNIARLLQSHGNQFKARDER